MFSFPKFLESRYPEKLLPERQRGELYSLFGLLFRLPFSLKYISIVIFFCLMVTYDLLLFRNSAISEYSELCLRGMTL